jgi:hypothetical protein
MIFILISCLVPVVKQTTILTDTSQPMENSNQWEATEIYLDNNLAKVYQHKCE